jgi:hypothetical protein
VGRRPALSCCSAPPPSQCLRAAVPKAMCLAAPASWPRCPAKLFCRSWRAWEGHLALGFAWRGRSLGTRVLHGKAVQHRPRWLSHAAAIAGGAAATGLPHGAALCCVLAEWGPSCRARAHPVKTRGAGSPHVRMRGQVHSARHMAMALAPSARRTSRWAAARPHSTLNRRSAVRRRAARPALCGALHRSRRRAHSRVAEPSPRRQRRRASRAFPG